MLICTHISGSESQPEYIMEVVGSSKSIRNVIKGMYVFIYAYECIHTYVGMYVYI